VDFGMGLAILYGMTTNNNRKENKMTLSELLFSSPCREWSFNGVCRNPNCENAVAEFPETGRWYILFSHAGFNSPANNGMGYKTKKSALGVMKRYLNS
jgi:hypothetical protein